MERGDRVVADRGRGRSRRRRWTRWLPEVLVVALLVAAGLSYEYDLGERWLGNSPADPTTEPAAVLPPEGLRLPAPAVAAPVAGRVTTKAIDPARVEAAVRPLLQRKVLGRHVGVLVTDLSNDKVAMRSGPAAVTPASTTKLLTCAAALESLGEMARFRTSVRWNSSSRTLVLVGGGDPFLASRPASGATPYPQRADVVTLARNAAARLREMQVKRVRLSYDDSVFTGPSVNPAWPSDYVPDGVVSPITALWVDEGRTPSGYGYVEDPSLRAAEVFADAVGSAGIKVRPNVTHAAGPGRGATEIAHVSSAPLGEIVERTLAVSDNQAAEVIARHVGRAEKQEGSFVAGAAAVLEVLRRLGVQTAGDQLYDGSGLSRRDLLSPETLAGVLRVASSPDHPGMRQVITGLPVAGFTGSLAFRFEKGPDAARGRVRAKTGTLTGVHGLAGVVDPPGGGRMAFVVVADRVPPAKSLESQVRVDQIAAALGACRCGVGSAS